MKYTTKGNFAIERIVKKINFLQEKEKIITRLNHEKGAYFCSSFEYPDRYARWDMGFVDPPLEIRCKGYDFSIHALTCHGALILNRVHQPLVETNHYQELIRSGNQLSGTIKQKNQYVAEEERSRKPSIFTLIRDIRDMFYSERDDFFGLYGAFGYDLIHQFETIELVKARAQEDEDLVLYIPDRIFIMDHQMKKASLYTYQLLSDVNIQEFVKTKTVSASKTNNQALIKPVKGEYAALVQKAKALFKNGDLFEVVPSHLMEYNTQQKASDLFHRLTEINPSPYGFFINLGDEKLIGASPEMYVRVCQDKIETCPISGTIKRGRDAIEDQENIMTLLNSVKEESELTMCTDVDRNDKSRICKPGSVKVVGRRQIEKYSHLIHTVDHVTGILREEYDGIDAFVTHMWAVTVTGAPKRNAMIWIEENEAYPRRWYAGAIGFIGFNGDINTGLSLRMIDLKHGKASLRVGATLLNDSIPEMEEEETYIKAKAMVKVLTEDHTQPKSTGERLEKYDMKILIIDHEDSFVHTLGDYFRTFGATTETVRHQHAMSYLQANQYDLVVLSPGPGKPDQFKLQEKIDYCLQKEIPLFGVCLGLQAIIEYFGGILDYLEHPSHGKKSVITVLKQGKMFQEMGQQMIVGRYHSLYGRIIPATLSVTSISQDGIVMSIEHKELPVFGVQFHPESIMTLTENNGMTIIKNILKTVKEHRNEKNTKRIS